MGVGLDRLYFGDEAEAFITAEPDIGRKVVNAVYLLWEQGVISVYNHSIPGFPPYYNDSPNQLILYVKRFDEQVQRLIVSLDEYAAKKDTFNNPDQYLESIKTSVANEINSEIKRKDHISPLGVEDVISEPRDKKQP